MSANRRMMMSLLAAQTPPVMTDKIWDFLEPDYAFAHVNIGNPVVAGNGIQHWMSREGKKALGAEIYYSPNFYDTLGVGCSYDSVSDQYTFSGTSNAFVVRSVSLLSVNKLYNMEYAVVSPSGRSVVVGSDYYVGGMSINITTSGNAFLQPRNEYGAKVAWFGPGVPDGDASFKVDSIKPIDSILAYQSTSTSRPIARVDSRGVMYSEWDLTDDSLTAYFDSPITDGEMMIATSVGIWFEKFSTTTSQLDFGPTSLTGGTTGLFNILKDPTTDKMHMYAGRVMPNREYTAEEKAWLIYLYSAVCGKGLITLGEELKHLFTPLILANGVAEYDDINDIWHITRGGAETVGGSANYPAQAGVYLRDVQRLSGNSINFRVNNTVTTSPTIFTDPSSWKGVAVHTSGDIRINHTNLNQESTFRIHSVKKVIFP